MNPLVVCARTVMRLLPSPSDFARWSLRHGVGDNLSPTLRVVLMRDGYASTS